MALREIWDAFTRDSLEMYDICLDTLRIMASNPLEVREVLPTLIDEGQRLHFLRVAYFLDHELLTAAYRCYGSEFDFELARHLVAAIESGRWPTCEVGPISVLHLTEALNPKDDMLNPRIFWRLNFNNCSSEALDVLRIVASFVAEKIDSGGDTVFDAVYAVTDNSLMRVNLLTLLYQVREHVGVLSNREAARHVVSAIESGEWWSVSVKPNKH